LNESRAYVTVYVPSIQEIVKAIPLQRDGFLPIIPSQPSLYYFFAGPNFRKIDFTSLFNPSLRVKCLLFISPVVHACHCQPTCCIKTFLFTGWLLLNDK